ncbi:MAG TPA: TfoX/Sxy family protein [Actinomycetota bacterium]|nr:TfoX/Sxy family protein [Actinomycetota bacterium]
MRSDSGFLDFVLDQLRALDDVEPRAMFGGHGLYAGPVFFGVVYDERLYLKTDDATRGWYEERGMPTFRPNERQNIKSYHEVPADALEDADELVELARRAIDAQRSA